MATKDVVIRITAKNLTKKEFASARKGLKGLDKQSQQTQISFRQLAIGFTAVAATIGASIRAYDEQIQSITNLNIALANQGNLLPGTSKSLQAYASELQKITTVGDEVILSNMALLASFGANEEQIRKTIPVALDFAAATGRDLKQAIGLLGKAFVGETGELSRYGIIIDKNIPKSEKFDAVIEQMTKRFGGMAQAQTATLTGRIKQLGNTSGDTLEQFGKFSTFMATQFTGDIGQGSSILEWLGDLFGKTLPTAISEFRAQIFEGIGAIIDMSATVQETFPRISEFFGINSETTRAMAQGQRDLAADIRVAADAFVAESGAIEPVNRALAEAVTKNTDLGNTATTAGVNLASLMPIFDELKEKFNENSEVITFWGENTKEMFQQNTIAADVFAGRILGVGDIVGAQTKSMTAAFAAFGFQTKTEMAALLEEMEKNFEEMQKSGEATDQALAESAQKLADFKKKLSGEEVEGWSNTRQSIADITMAVAQSAGEAYKSMAVAGVRVAIQLAIAKSLASLPWPFSLVAAAGAAAAGAIVLKKLQGTKAYRAGTLGLDYESFGTETPAMLHGKEAVIPQGGGHRLAEEISGALARMGGGKPRDTNIIVERFERIGSKLDTLPRAIQRAVRDGVLLAS